MFAPLDSIDPVLQDVFVDVSSLSWFLNGGLRGETILRPESFHHALISVGYRLIEINPLAGPRTLDTLEHALHLGLFLFLKTFLKGLGRNDLKFSLLLDLARSVLQEYFDQDRKSQELLLWMLFMGRASIFEEKDGVWLTPMVLKACVVLQIRKWEDILVILSKFPWVDAIHTKLALPLWTQSKDHVRLHISEIQSTA